MYPPEYVEEQGVCVLSKYNLAPAHVIGSDLRIPTKEAIAKDDPALYYYMVYITHLEKDKCHEKGKPPVKNDKGSNLIRTLQGVKCSVMR